MQLELLGPLVMNSPILGIGLPGAILVFLSSVTACSVSMDIGNKRLNLTKQERRLGFVLSLITELIIYIGVTVFYWGTVFILIMFLAGIRAHLGALEPCLDDDG